MRRAFSPGRDEVRVIGVDSDWSRDLGDPNRAILTSVVKDLGPAVFNQASAIVSVSWQGGVVWEDLASGATYIAGFGKTNPQVPGYLKNDLKAICEAIIDGTIPTMP